MKFTTVCCLLLATVASLVASASAQMAATVNADGKCPVIIGGLFPIRDTPWGFHLEAAYEASLLVFNKELAADASSTIMLEAMPFSTSTATKNSDAGTAVVAVFEARDKVIGMVGACYSSTASPAQQVAKIFDIPQVSPSATSPTLSDKTNFPTFFRTTTSDAFQGDAVTSMMAFFGWKKFAIINCNGIYCVKGAEAVQDFAAGRNQTVAYTNSYPRETQDAAVIDKLLDGIKATGVKIIMLFSLGGEIEFILPRMALKDMKEGGFVIILADAGAQRTYTVAGDWSGLLCMTPAAGRGEKFEAFLDDFSSTYNQPEFTRTERFIPAGGYIKAEGESVPEDYTLWGARNLDPFGGYSYDAATSFGVAARALDQAGKTPCNTELIAYRKAMQEQLKVTNFQGFTGEVFFDQNQDRIGGYDFINLDGSGAGKWNNIGFWSRTTGVELVDDTTMPVWLASPNSGKANAPKNPPETVTCYSGSFRVTLRSSLQVCVPCPPDTFAIGINNEKCTSCPGGGICLGGKTINAAADYWQGGAPMLEVEDADLLMAGDKSIVVPEFFRCNDDSCCVDGGCVVDPTGITEEIVCLGCKFTDSTRCHTNREGLLCADCESGTNEWGASCVECTDPAGEWMVLIIAIVFLLIFVLTREVGEDAEHSEGERIVVDGPAKAAEPEPEKGGLIRRLSRKLAAKFKTYYSVFGVLLRMTIEYMQLLGLIVKVSFLAEVLPWFYLSLNFVIASVSSDDPQCIFEISEVQRALLGFLLIFLIYMQLFFCAGVSFALQKYVQKVEEPNLNRYHTGFWRLSFFCFPIFLSYELNLLACVDIDGTSVLVLTPAVRCWESAHVLAVVLLGLFCILVVGGLPAWLIYTLNPTRNPELSQPRLYGMLCAPFKPACSHWYGVFAFIRRVVAFAARVAFVENIKLQKSVIGMVVVGYLLIQLAYRPYRRALINYIQCTFFACVLLCVMLQMGDTNQNRFDDSKVDPYTTFKDVMVTLFVFTPCAMVPFLMHLETAQKAKSPASVAAPKSLGSVMEMEEDFDEDAAVPEYFFSFADEDPSTEA